MDANSTFKNVFCKLTMAGPVPVTINMTQVAVATANKVILVNGISLSFLENFQDAFVAQHGSDAFFSTFATLTTSDNSSGCYNTLVTAANTTIYVPYCQISHVVKNFAGSGAAAAHSLVFGVTTNLAVKESAANFQLVDGFRQFTIRTGGSYGATCKFTAVAADPLYANLEYIGYTLGATNLYFPALSIAAVPVLESIEDQIGAN